MNIVCCEFCEFNRRFAYYSHNVSPNQNDPIRFIDLKVSHFCALFHERRPVRYTHLMDKYSFIKF